MFARNERDSDSDAFPRRDEREDRSGREERRVAAWIGESLVVKGDVTSSEDMTIAGQVEGDVVVREHSLVITSTARVRGNIIARSVAVHGVVTGTVKAESKLEVGETGSVDGEMVTARMVVAEGAVLSGRVGIGSPVQTVTPRTGESVGR